MLNRFIHSARLNVFESARFYYWVLITLSSYTILNRFLQKLSFVYQNNQWVELKIGEGILFGLAYLILLISTWFLRSKVLGFIMQCWGVIVCIFLFNEFRHAWELPNYSIIESFTKGQGYYTAKVTMPLLFFGVWSVLKKTNHYGVAFINKLHFFLLVNAVFIISGVMFNVSLFESYPLSGRWGYSGLLWHLSFHNIVYGVFLLYLFEQKKKQWGTIILFGSVLLLLGQKAAMFYFLLIFTFGLITNQYLQKVIIAIFLATVFSAKLWVPYVITFSTFWKKVYNEYGVWGVLLSLRNENIQSIWDNVNTELTVIDIVLGGIVRYPSKIEMMPFDFLIYFGFVGLIVFTWCLVRIIPRWIWSIPFFVACFGGGIYEVPLGMLIFFIMLECCKATESNPNE